MDPRELPVDPERIWTSVAGEWTFDVDVPVTAGGRTIEPAVSASQGGVTVTWEELELVPSGPVARLTVRGLPELPAGSARGWYPVLSAEHEWKITIDGFWSSFDPTHEGFGHALGPWVLEVDVPAGS